MLIAAFDLATTTGCADGMPNGKPRSWTWRLSEAGDARPERLALLRDYCDRYFRESRPAIVVYEKPLPIAAAYHHGSAEAVTAMLRGAIGVLESSAAKAGITRIAGLGVQDARQHLTGRRTFPKGAAKDEVFAWCRRLGWRPLNTDESDSLCLWSYACALANPRTSHLVTPLFAETA
jgi:hypothetical protein